MNVATFVNGATSTSFPVELSVKIDKVTEADVTIVSYYDSCLSDADPDVATLDMDFVPLGATSRFDLSAFRDLRKRLSKFDILHTHYNFAGSIGRLVATGTDTKIINTEHTDHSHLKHVQNVVNCPTYPMVDYMIFNSKSTYRSLRKYELPFLRGVECSVIHNGIDFDRLQSGQDRPDLPELPDGPKIVTAARLVEAKNIEILVRAMGPILAAIPEAELIIVGSGPQLEHLQETAEHAGVEDSVSFLGRLEREQVYGVLSNCTIFAVPSKYEGFCNAAVEAMGCGLPVVASDITVLREVIGDTGIFASPIAPEEFAEAIIQLLNDPRNRKIISEKSQNRANANFSIERTAKSYFKKYVDVIESQ